MSELNLEREHGITIAKRRTSEDLLHDEGPYAKILLDLVQVAKQKRASDIHIEPTDQGIDLRLRVDGSILLYKSITREHRESLILETKRIFGLSIGMSGRPQDGRASLPSFKLDLRVSLLPTYYGEKVVMRLLDLDVNFDLEALGFLETEREMLKRAIRFDDGVVIISGPTGSGKTRTLYSLLKALNPKTLNIVTLEDPIEYRIDGLNQVQISKRISFSDALRAVLRQDPDVILVGEVRDAETAKLCFQAAETGHLVFTTLHANGALEVIERLYGLGMDKLTLQSNLRFSIAQRLEQRLCSGCADSYDIDLFKKTMRNQVLFPLAPKKRNEQGCSLCFNGIRGRIPILEWAEVETIEGVKTPKLCQSLEDAKFMRAARGEINCLEVI